MEESPAPEEAIFYEALQVADPAARDALLDRLCAGEPRLRREVESLLHAHAQAGGFLHASQPAMRPPADGLPDGPAYTDASVGTWIGPYKLVQWLGEGGGGVVYMAEQQQPMRRRVALKVIKLGMDTRRVIARFEAERQTLALMEHPNIARVLDAGATETGRPFFVMELLRGTRITDYCEKHQLPLEPRLRLFQQVCHGVEHAHQKGIIHRDLKPSNILVTLQDGVPVPKIIDFGIAKATAGSPADATGTTSFGQMIGTPAYMSPEQVQGSGVDVDTRSDLYSLGVVLYELLAGRPPFDNEELLRAGVDGMRGILRDRQPMRPSVSVATRPPRDAKASGGSLPPPGISAHALRGDLDWVVMKSLEKDRSRRYQTARGLAIDLDRHLSSEPVSARPPSRRYRFQKLVARNKATFAAIGATTAALFAGLALSTWLFFKAREAEHQQAHLRLVAEQALTHEAELRQEAENREKITRAAILIARHKTAEADALLGTAPVPVFEPSVEATNVFRALGYWSAEQKNWPRAANRLLSLVQANRIDESDQTDEATRDLLAAAPALIEARDFAGYEQVCNLALRNFSRTPNPVAAEHVLKISTLLPPSARRLEELKPLEELEKESLQGRDPRTGSYIEGWRCAVLAMVEYRRGHYEEALAWGERCRMHPNNTRPRDALVYAVESMALHGLKRDAEARARADTVKVLIKDWQTTSPRRGEAWFDWLGAEILLREAEALLEPPNRAPRP